MSDVFISYRRRPSASLALLVQAKLKAEHGMDAYVDTTRTDSTRIQFPERLMQAIDDAPVFVCLLGEGTLESEWVVKEIERAYLQDKFCIPVFQETYTPASQSHAAIDYLLNHDGVHIFDQKNVMVTESINQLADLIEPHRERNITPSWRKRLPVISAYAFSAIALLVVIVLALNSGALGVQNNPDETPNAVVAEVDGAPTDTSVVAEIATTIAPVTVSTALPTIVGTAISVVPTFDFAGTMSALDATCRTSQNSQAIDVMFLLDNSASMTDGFDGEATRMDALIESLDATLSNTLRLDDGHPAPTDGFDQVGLVSFSQVILASLDFTPDKNTLTNFLGGLYSDGGTDIASVLGHTTDLIVNSSYLRPSVPLVIVLTDALDGVNNVATRANELHENTGADIYAIGIGDETDYVVLEAIASDNANFWHVETAQELEDALTLIIYRHLGCV
jgi:hypothetical protein